MNKRNTGFNTVPFLILLAFLLGGIFASNAQSRNINLGLDHVSIGYGPMSFPAIGDGNPTQGGAAYLAIGGRNGGGMLFIGGDSQISYGGGNYGSGMVGLTGFRDLPLSFNGKDTGIKIGGFVGIVGFQTYRKADLTQGQFRAPDPFPRPELEKTNIQPYGGLRLVIKRLEVQYAPVSNMVTFGIKLL